MNFSIDVPSFSAAFDDICYIQRGHLMFSSVAGISQREQDDKPSKKHLQTHCASSLVEVGHQAYTSELQPMGQ